MTVGGKRLTGAEPARSHSRRERHPRRSRVLLVILVVVLIAVVVGAMELHIHDSQLPYQGYAAAAGAAVILVGGFVLLLVSRRRGQVSESPAGAAEDQSSLPQEPVPDHVAHSRAQSGSPAAAPEREVEQAVNGGERPHMTGDLLAAEDEGLTAAASCSGSPEGAEPATEISPQDPARPSVQDPERDRAGGQEDGDQPAPTSDITAVPRQWLPQSASPPLPVRRPLLGIGDPEKSARMGLSVEPDGMRFVQIIAGRPSGPVLHNCGYSPLPSGAMGPEGEIDPGILTPALDAFLKRHGVRRRRGAVSLGKGGLVRLTRMPAMSRKELFKALRWETDKHFPLTWDEAYVDAVFLDPHKRQGRIEVFLAAYPREVVDGLMVALRGAQFTPLAIEVPALAAGRALSVVPGAPWRLGSTWKADSVGRMVATLDLGYHATWVSLFQDGIPVLDRSIPRGGRTLLRAIAGLLSISEDEATGVVLAGPPGSQHGFMVGESLQGLLAEAIRPIGYYLLQSRVGGLARVYVSGFLSGMEGILPAVEQQVRGEAGAYLSAPEGDLALIPDVGGALSFPLPIESARELVDARYLTALGLALWTEARGT